MLAESHAAPADAIDVRRPQVGRAVAGQVTEPLIVAHNDHKIRRACPPPARRLGRFRSGRGEGTRRAGGALQGRPPGDVAPTVLDCVIGAHAAAPAARSAASALTLALTASSCGRSCPTSAGRYSARLNASRGSTCTSKSWGMYVRVLLP